MKNRRYRLKWQDSDEVIYELISVDLGYAQLRNLTINTIKWANTEHLIECEE